MKQYYYNSELDKIESMETIRSDYYDLFGEEYETFDEYLNACMYYNNGVLYDIADKLKHVKRELNRKLMLAQKYSYEEYEEEILDLLEQMNTYGKYVRGRA